MNSADLSPILCGRASTNCGPRTRAFRTAFCNFFNGQDVVVLSHGITKGQKVPDEEIRRAIQRKQLVLEYPARYTTKLTSKEV